MVKEMFLIAGEITYRMADGDIKFFKKLNSVTARPTGYAIMKGDDLIYMTNALIGNFREFMDKSGYAKDAYIVEDCVILSVKNLGIQEADEFMPEEKHEEEKKEEETPQQ